MKIDSGICYGQTDVPLADSFAEEVKVVQSKLPNLPRDTLVVTSPLQRCLKLAKQLANEGQLLTDQRIMELHFGDWEMQPWNNIDQIQWQEWMRDCITMAPPKGESFLALFDRCQGFWQEIVTEACQTLVVVTHAGVIRALLALVLEIPLKNTLRIQVEFGAINQLKHYQDCKTNYSWTTVEYLNR